MIYTVTLSAALDKTLTISDFTADSVNRVSAVRLDAGGKGINVSKTVKALGGESVALGVLGGDTGVRIAAMLQKEGIECDFVFDEKETRTNIKINDPLRGTHTDINEPGTVLDEGLRTAVEKRLFARVRAGDFVALSCGMPRGDSAFIADWCRRISEAGAYAAVDLDGEWLARAVEGRPYIIKPNGAELSRLCEVDESDTDGLMTAARGLARDKCGCVALSLGAAGAFFAVGNDEFFVAAPKVKAVSTVGAGDALAAALIYAKSIKMGWREAARFAVAASAAKVESEGSSPPNGARARALVAETFFCEIPAKQNGV